MTTFPRGHSAYMQRIENAKLIAKLDPGERPVIVAATGTRFEFPDPVDMRGIPALGPGVGGTMRGTQPEARATR